MLYILENGRQAYIGESSHVKTRMTQHSSIEEKRIFDKVHFIYSKLFNQSVTFDYESKLIQYIAADELYEVTNKNKGIADKQYYQKQEYDEKFATLWRKLQREKLVKHSIEEIENSDLFKYSPYKELNDSQRQAVEDIVQKLKEGTVDKVVVNGMPGSGKSTVGVVLAKTLGMDFVDVDLLICRREDCTLQEILDRRGLDAFLQVEEETVLETEFRDTVIATGGSVPMSEKAMAHLAQHGRFVYLDVPLPELERRIHNITTRGIAFAPGQTLADIYALRTPLYRRWADATVSVIHTEHTVEPVVEEIIRVLRPEAECFRPRNPDKTARAGIAARAVVFSVSGSCRRLLPDLGSDPVGSFGNGDILPDFDTFPVCQQRAQFLFGHQIHAAQAGHLCIIFGLGGVQSLCAAMANRVSRARS